MIKKITVFVLIEHIGVFSNVNNNVHVNNNAHSEMCYVDMVLEKVTKRFQNVTILVLDEVDRELNALSELETFKRIQQNYNVEVVDSFENYLLRKAQQVKETQQEIEAFILYQACYPFMPDKCFDILLESMNDSRAVSLVAPVVETLKLVDDSHMVIKTVDREEYVISDFLQGYKLSIFSQNFKLKLKNNRKECEIGIGPYVCE